MITYAIIIERADDGGYGAWCPELPGCVALGDTEEETVAEMRQAMKLHLAGMREDGIEIPRPSTVSVTTVTLPLSSAVSTPGTFTNRPRAPRRDARAAVSAGA